MEHNVRRRLGIIVLRFILLVPFSAIGVFLILRNPDSLWAVASFWFAIQSSIDWIIAPTAWEHGMKVRFAAQKAGMHDMAQHILQTMVNPMKNTSIVAGGFVLIVAGIFQQRIWLILVGSIIFVYFIGISFFRTARRRVRVLDLLRSRIDALASADIPDEEKVRSATNLVELYRLLKW